MLDVELMLAGRSSVDIGDVIVIGSPGVGAACLSSSPTHGSCSCDHRGPSHSDFDQYDQRRVCCALFQNQALDRLSQEQEEMMRSARARVVCLEGEVNKHEHIAALIQQLSSGKKVPLPE